MRSGAIAVLLLCAGCKTPAAATYRVHDLTPTFWKYWDGAAALPEAEQRARLEAEVVAAHPDVYTAHVIGLDEAKPFSEALAPVWPKWLAFAGKRLPLARKLSASIGVDLPRYDARFREAFPDFAYDGEVYFLVSLGGFDGGVRKVKGRDALLFGVDVIARVYGEDANPESFFHHELFHLYQRQFPDPQNDGTLLRALWMEGLAELVADRLNPGTPESVLLGLPVSSPPRVRAALPALAKAFRAKLGSTSEADYAQWFFGSSEGATPPARAGYTLGYLVAKEVAGTRSLSDLARLKGPQLKAEVEAALDRLSGL